MLWLLTFALGATMFLLPHFVLLDAPLADPLVRLILGFSAATVAYALVWQPLSGRRGFSAGAE